MFFLGINFVFCLLLCT